MREIYRDVLLAVIAASLAFIAVHLWTYRPVTRGEVAALIEAEKEAELELRYRALPMVQIKGSVDVEGAVSIDGSVGIR